MSTFSHTLSDHHKHCDEAFALAEEAVARERWSEARALAGEFARQLEAHFSAEESTLFPAFESASGMTQGPTQVMRMEHMQMRALLEQMKQAVAAGDADGYAGTAQTLLILMQQHNMKEENILYPMCDRLLATEAGLHQSVSGALAAVA